MATNKQLVNDDVGEKCVRIPNPSRQNSSKSKYSNLQDFLFKHRHVKKDKNSEKSSDTEEQKPPTHTRIGDASSGIHGGSYTIPDDEYDEFMNMYYKEVVQKGTVEYLTEKQLSNGKSPIAVDIDLQFALDLKERVYTDDHIDEFVDTYLASLKDKLQFDEDTLFPVFIFEKENLNHVTEKKITKDGIHMIIGVQMDHVAQRLLRQDIIPVVAELWGDFPIVNKWDDVFDECISNGINNWQLIGSRKPNHEAYRLTKVYHITYDPDDGELINTPAEPEEYMKSFEKFKQMSVRYDQHPQFFFTSSFMARVDAVLQSSSGASAGGRRRGGTPSPNIDENAFLLEYGSGGAMSMRDLSQIRSREDLDYCVQRFLESISVSTREYVLREMYEYTMVLPESYYGQGSYSKWIRVGWALKNTSSRLLIVWLAFSAKSPTFQCSSIPDLCDQWSKFDRKSSCVTNRSIIYWAMHDNPNGSDGVRKNTISYYLDQTINTVTANSLSNPNRNAKGAGDYDIAVVLHQMFKDEYICSDVKNGIWYRFKNHRWKQIDSGTYLRKAISNELRDLYTNRATELGQYKATLDPEDEKYKHITARIETIMKIVLRLGQTSDKKNIMQEAKDLFYDPEFYNRLDSNPYLLCCKNGVIDFKNKEFRKGLPEDYLTKCTEIEYTPIANQKHAAVKEEIHDFMTKLFPKSELRKYMWNHLSAVLIGMPSINQTFNNYIGNGQNGKSVLTDLMSQTLGNYKVAAPISIITQGRGKVGGLAPEIVALKGARYVVMQEPESGDSVHEGPMKELVSGVEPISARAPYMTEQVVFVPQFALVVCCNQYMSVKTQDHGTWRRFRVVPFESLFTEKPVDDDPEKPYQYKLDRNLTEKFPVWRETFLSMLVELAYENQGKVTDCEIVMAASNAYRERQDYLAEFVRDKVVRSQGSTIRKVDLSNEFKVWYNINFGTRNPSPKNLHDYMDKQYGKQRGGVWLNVKLKYHDDDNDFEAPHCQSGDECDNAVVEFNEL